MEFFSFLQFCLCLNLVEGTDKRILGGIPVFDYFGMYISFDDNFGHSTKFDNIFTLTEERWGFMVSIHVLINGNTFPLEMLGQNSVASPEMTTGYGD